MTDSSDHPIVALKDVQYRWPGRTAFGLDISEFRQEPGETVLLLGESGSGKSTLLSLICGAVAARSGHVQVKGVELSCLSSSARDRFRAETIGVIFQQFNLLPFGTVRDNVLLPLQFAPDRRKRTGDAVAAAGRYCEALGLPATLLNARAGRLSVGQQQRVAVARALIGEPPLIVADEPTSALDAGTQTAFLDLLFEQVRGNAASLLMVSHDTRLTTRFDRVLRIEDIATAGIAAA